MYVATVCYLLLCFHRPRSWIESQKMETFMSVAKGSSEEPWLLELHYNCPNAGREEEKEMEMEKQEGGESEEGRPTVLVGKGANIHVYILKFHRRKLSQSCSDLHDCIYENFCNQSLILVMTLCKYLQYSWKFLTGKPVLLSALNSEIFVLQIIFPHKLLIT